ncbi:MAG: HD-GYP domain-containing protein [Bacillota bacterium]
MNKKVKIFLAIEYFVFILFAISIFFLYPIGNFNFDVIFFLATLFILSNLSYFINFKSNTSTSISLPVLIPAMTMLNPFWVLIIAFVGTSELNIRENKLPWYKFLFNRCMFGIAAGSAALIYKLSISILTSNIIIALFFASIIYFSINIGLVYIVIYLSDEKQKVSYTIFLSELIKSIFISYFLGLILYFSYIQFGKLFFMLVIILIYIARDFFFSRLQVLNTFTQIIESFLKVIDSKDHYTEGHCERVANYTKKLCDTIKVNQRKKEKIVNMAKIHDIGKIYVDDQILKSDDILDEEEFNEMKKHSYYGYELLKDIDMLNDDLEIILHHHEFYNGNGYPDGIKGEEIPLGARILNICDSFDVMTTGRSYKKALNKKETIEELKNCSKKQFDPELVEAMVDLIEEGTFNSSFKQN